MALLSRVADRIYWAARYMERAEDTARVVRAFGDVFVELPSIDSDDTSAWAPLTALIEGVQADSLSGETATVRFLVADRSNPGSVVTCVEDARANLRTTREVLPREAWQAVNDLWLFVEREIDRVPERRFRHRILNRVIDDSRRLDGILMSTMTRDAAYDIWRIGRLLERAEMTTRVVGVRAAALMAPRAPSTLEHDEIHWMGVLRSLSALQMYQRATRGPIEGAAAVRFLLFHEGFPRSVAGALNEIEISLARLSRGDEVREAMEELRRVLRSTTPMADDGVDLDRAMERVQAAIARLSNEITDRYLSVGGGDPDE